MERKPVLRNLVLGWSLAAIFSGPAFAEPSAPAKQNPAAKSDGRSSARALRLSKSKPAEPHSKSKPVSDLLRPPAPYCVAKSETLANDADSKRSEAEDLRRRQRAAIRATSKPPYSDLAARELLAVYEKLRTSHLLDSLERNQVVRSTGLRLLRIATNREVRAQRSRRSIARSQRNAAESPTVVGSFGGKDDTALLSEESPGVIAANSANSAKKDALGAAGGGAQAEGDELVELIRATVDPDSWDVNGGDGVIIYYSPLKVLVIRQTGEVHGHVGDVLGGLRQ